MAETKLMTGNEALARGALAAGLTAYFGYPITPQSEILEYLAQELPRMPNGVFIQTEDEIAASGMVRMSAACGRRAMTSTSTPGFCLMQEWISSTASSFIPAVFVNVARNAFPGSGGAAWGNQGDYLQATRGGGGGGYKCIVISPWSAQESYELIQLAFHLADKYQIPVIFLSAGNIGMATEKVEMKTMEFGPLPPKNWALTSQKSRGGKTQPPIIPPLGPGKSLSRDFVLPLYQKVADAETRWEEYETADAKLLIVAYSYVAKVGVEAVRRAREKGIKVGLLRPITLWPFPYAAIEKAAAKAGKVLVCEDSIEQMKQDVDIAVKGKAPVHFLGNWGRTLPSGFWHPERILEEIETVMKA
ncbi:MAG: 3-methyl-2-oxobutanoate dehydrogenase subunit beta [Chloroflexi bacterium]|nr:3-methyl-2-oxobutanoate dehydrogenase subunit beta [Chloroflexota bacterium]